MAIRKKLGDIAGRVCEALLPIRQEYFLGRGDRVAICTLSSMDLLSRISSSQIMESVAIAGRLLSENRGIDEMISFTLKHPKLERIIICGREVKGHTAGQALLSLVSSGTDSNGRIIGAIGPYPFLQSSPSDVERFRKQVKIVDLIGTTDIGELSRLIS